MPPDASTACAAATWGEERGRGVVVEVVGVGVITGGVGQALHKQKPLSSGGVAAALAPRDAMAKPIARQTAAARPRGPGSCLEEEARGEEGDAGRPDGHPVGGGGPLSRHTSTTYATYSYSFRQ